MGFSLQCYLSKLHNNNFVIFIAGDFSEEGRASNWAVGGSGGAATSRHHSSCSDNSLLSIDSMESQHHYQLPTSGWSGGAVSQPRGGPQGYMSGGPSWGEGQLSHAAARHKMSVRPRRNHAGKKPRHPPVLQGLTEEAAMPDDDDVKADESCVIDSRVEPPGGGGEYLAEQAANSRNKKSKAKSRSLDIPLGSRTPGTGSQSSPPSVLERTEGQRHSKSKLEGGDSRFLSRLFGSKRAKSKTTSSLPHQQVVAAAASPTEEEWSRPTRYPTKQQQNSNSVNNIRAISQFTTAEEEELKSGDPVARKQHQHQHQLAGETVSAARGGGGGGRSYNKQKPPPPPPSSPPPPLSGSAFFNRSHNSGTIGSLPKSPSFNSADMMLDYPSLPTVTGNTSTGLAISSDIILKKNRSLGSVLETSSSNSSHQRFHSSVENWSFANEGLKRSIGSLADRPFIMSSHSNESLKTITSLLEEPDILVQTRVSDCAAATAAAAAAAVATAASAEKQLGSSCDPPLPPSRFSASMEELKEGRNSTGMLQSASDDKEPVEDDEEDMDVDEVEDISELVRSNTNYDVIFSAPLFVPDNEATVDDDDDGDKEHEETVLDDEEYVVSSEPSSFEMMMTNTESRDFDDDEDSSVEDLPALNNIMSEDASLSKAMCNNNLNTLEAKFDTEKEKDGDNSFLHSNLSENSTVHNLAQVLPEVEVPPGQALSANTQAKEAQLQHNILFEDTSSVDFEKDMSCGEQVNVQDEITADNDSQPHCPPLSDAIRSLEAASMLDASALPDQETAAQSDRSMDQPPSLPPPSLPPPPPPVDDCVPLVAKEVSQPADQPTAHKSVAEMSPPHAVESAAGSVKISPAVVEGKGEQARERPEVSAKPVPAPRHFFLRPVLPPVAAAAPLEETSGIANSELQSVWATRRTRSMRSLVGGQEEMARVLPDGQEKELDHDKSTITPMADELKDNQLEKMELSSPRKEGTEEKEEDKDKDNNDPLINVKERARSFSSGLQNGLANFGPKPFRPPAASSIVQEIRNSKPVNIPPKPKVVVLAKPVPAPRQVRSVSSSLLEAAPATKPASERPAVKSASGLLTGSRRASFQGRTAVETRTSTNKPPSTSAADDTAAEMMSASVGCSPAAASSSATSSDISSSSPPREQLTVNQLEDIHVRKLVSNFQSCSPPCVPGSNRISGSEVEHSKSMKILSKSQETLPAASSEQEPAEKLPASTGGGGVAAEEPVFSPSDALRRSGKSPEKPARRSRDKSSERTLSAAGDSGSNVMSIVTRLNALAL
jgi:hypothetical protein